MKGQPGTCAVGSCSEEPVEGAIFCGALGNGHLTDSWMGRLVRLPDGTFAIGPQPRLVEPEWRRRARLGMGRGLDLTGAVRS